MGIWLTNDHVHEFMIVEGFETCRDKDSFACFPIRVDSHKQVESINFFSRWTSIRLNNAMYLIKFLIMDLHP